MAFKDVNEKLECVKTSEMEVGSSVEGYVVGFSRGSVWHKYPHANRRTGKTSCSLLDH